jgi:cellulose biosynthesis protein BcsQ
VTPSSATGKPPATAREDTLPKTTVPIPPAAVLKNNAGRAPHSQQQEWAVLESLSNLRAQFAGSAARRADQPEARWTAIFGIRGGVGATTIVSALGKISAKAAKRVLLLDASSPSLLPLYFGGQLPSSGIATFISSGQLQEGPIYVACGNVDGSIRTLMCEMDRVYADGGLFRARQESLLPSSPEVPLLVLIPDTRCVVELNRLEGEGVDIPHLLLNQFDGSQALHREVQYRLAKQFSDRLIPVTLSRDPDVSVSLAQGTTIIDYSPGSCVSEDLYKLNDWLAANLQILPKLETATAGQRL